MAYQIFSGSSHISFAENICTSLGVALGKISIETFPDRETGVRLLQSVIGQDVFIIQTIAKNPDHFLMELLLIIDACKRGGAKSITAIIPYFGYARQDRISKKGEPITAKLIARMIEKAGATAVITADLHSMQIQGFFEIPLYHVHMRPIFLEKIKKLHLKHSIIVSPDIGSNQLARKFAKDLKIDLAIVDKKRVSKEEVVVEALIGDVKGKEVILVDDICSTGSTLLSAAKICKEKGAKKIIAIFSHGLMTSKFFDQPLIDHCYMSDTVYFDEKEEKLSILPSSEIFVDMIKKML